MNDMLLTNAHIVVPIILLIAVLYKLLRRLKFDGREYPPEYVFLFVFIQSLLHFYLPIQRIIEYPFTLWGLVFVVGRYGSRFMFRSAFDRHNTTCKPLQVSNHLFTTGFYGLSRNPIYLVMMIMLLGTAILFGSLTPFLIIPIFPVLIHFRFVRHEEAILEETFGDEYRQYKSRVRRWI